MFKIFVLLFLLLLVGGVITRRAIRLVAVAALIVLLAREIGRLNINYTSFFGCNSGNCCRHFSVTDSYEHELPVVSGSVLSLTSAFGGTINIQGWDKPLIRIAVTKRAGTEEDLDKIKIGVSTDAQQDVAAKMVDISGTADGFSWSSNDGQFSFSWARSSWNGPVPCVDYELFVPKTTMKSLNLRFTSGSVQLNSVLVSDSMDVNLRSGQLLASNIGGDVNVHSGSGQVELKDIQGSVHVDAHSGCVFAENITENASVRTASGPAKLLNIGGSVKVNVRSGNIYLDGVQEHVDAKAASGPITMMNVAHSVDAFTRSGSISITRAPNAQGVIKASTKSGHIHIKDSNGNTLAQGRGQVTVR